MTTSFRNSYWFEIIFFLRLLSLIYNISLTLISKTKKETIPSPTLETHDTSIPAYIPPPIKIVPLNPALGGLPASIPPPLNTSISNIPPPLNTSIPNIPPPLTSSATFPPPPSVKVPPPITSVPPSINYDTLPVSQEPEKKPSFVPPPLTPTSSSPQFPAQQPAPNQPQGIMGVALYNFAGNAQKQQIDLIQNAPVTVYSTHAGGWAMGYCNGKTGFFPISYIRTL